MAKAKRGKRIRVGVVGIGRGASFARGAGGHLGMELVALCDIWEERLRALGKELNVATYTDYEKFLQHEMDAVILANYFHEHAPFAIKALKAGMHVMSETAACFTLAEGVALVEAVEESGRIYMFAENYPYSTPNQEMRRRYREGLIGEFKYGEGEYVHPMTSDGINRISCGYNHWRNWLPATYYCTHSLAPVMFITDTMPAKVNAFIIAHDFTDEVYSARTARRGDMASAILVRMDSGAVVKLLQVNLRGHGNWVRIHGNKGLMETLRWGGANMLRIRREPFDKKPAEPVESVYAPEFPEHQELARRAGHGGGDFFMNYHFASAIRTGRQPYLDVYRGVAMSLVGIQAYRSALDDSNTFEIPDLRKKAARDKYRSDDWNPDPSRRKEGYPWPSILGDIRPSRKALAYARKVWRQQGHRGN
jgi:predicted dehydrogenase